MSVYPTLEEFKELFVGNLPHDCTEDHLTELFGKYGKVTNVRINQVQGRDNAVARGGKAPAFVPNFGFIMFESNDCVERALAAKPIMLYGNHRLNVAEKKLRAPRDGNTFQDRRQDDCGNRGSQVSRPTSLTKLKKKVRAILNKLCPQKFDILVEQFTALPITTQVHLQECMELIFEKAVDEPGFSVAYARMCQVLQMKKVLVENSETETVNFRKLLISRCQKEFDKDYMESLDRDKYRADMAAAQTDDDRKQIKAVFEQMEMKLRRRSLGNIRFIGELYKLQMLTARIMHECVKKLLKTTDEESLECLCRLLTTVGQVLDQETKQRLSKGPQNGLNDLSVYFTEMKKITQDKKVCSRVRFLMQDVIELRVADWKLRREIAGPKTIEQIHADVAKEELNAKLNQMSSGPPGPMPGRRDERSGRNDDRRSSRKGPERGEKGKNSTCFQKKFVMF